MRSCPACDTVVGDNAADCPQCGARLSGPTASFEPLESGLRDVAFEGEQSDVPVLVVQRGAEEGERFYLEGNELSVGRDPQSDIFLNDVTVSRCHAVIHTDDSGVTVADAGSLNGTYVNGVRVDKAVLRTGDALQVGRFRMVFLSGGGT